MKKKKILIILALMISIFALNVNAKTITTGRVSSTTGLRVRSGPGTSYSQVGILSHNARVQIVGEKNSEGGCDAKWYQIFYDSSSSSIAGYVCSSFVEDVTTQEVADEANNTPVENADSALANQMAGMTNEEFEQYLTNEGFPESYKVKLRELHRLHPKWIFDGIITNYSWEGALNTQDVNGVSFLNVNNNKKAEGYDGYLSILPADYNWRTNTFIPHDGLYWYQANREAIAYYLDPRNFLNEQAIFMFEDLTYHPSYQNDGAIKNVLYSDFMKQYSRYYDEAGKTYGTSPVFLAALSRQEVGTSNTNIVTNGHAGVLSDGVNYNGYYNFFNIGASSSSDPKLKSLQYAKSVGWNTQQKSIVGGARTISVNYVNCGQYTSYFQKFNLAPTATKGIWHQYDTNIASLESPAISTYTSYLKGGSIEEGFIFAIPIFSNMPAKTELPPKGNPNYYLNDLKVNGVTLSNFDGENTNYSIHLSYMEEITISATTVVSTSRTSGTGKVALDSDSKTFNVVVTAGNGKTRTYKINVTRDPKPVPTTPERPLEPNTGNENQNNNNNNNTNTNTNTNTEETVTPISTVLSGSGYNISNNYFTNITLGTDVKTIINNFLKNSTGVSVNVKDKNGNAKTNGSIVTGDKVIITTSKENKTIEAVIYGDLNGDGGITTLDLLKVQKHILGYSKLSGAYLKAADVDKNGSVSTLDLLKIQKSILNYANISQN